MAELSRADRISGGLIGLLVGDALGVPYEFHPASALPAWDALEMTPPQGFPRAHPGTPPGTWSDDGAHALSLLASLLHYFRLEPRDLADRLLNWLETGYLAVDARVFDVGNQTRRALEALRAGALPLDAGPSDECDNGNGSLMRVLPLALWHRGPDVELVRDACLQSRVTHGHARAQACCAAYVLWARCVLEERAQPWDEAIEALRQMWGPASPLRAELEDALLPAFERPPRGSGYVVDTLRAAVAANAAGSYEAVVKGAIALGDDTDTTACVAGGIAGLRFGLGGIPDRWRAALRGRELYEPLLQQLVERG